MIKKYLLYISTLCILMLSCENGVYFGPSEGSLGGVDTTITGENIGGEENQEESEEEVVHTGDFSFSYVLSQNSVSPENMMFSEPEGIYARISDTTGNGFTIDFDISLVLPETEANKNVTVKIGNYENSIGDEGAISVRFKDSSNEKIFESSSSAKLQVIMAENQHEQRGVLPITFTYDPTVYNDSVPRTLYFLVSSKGNFVKKTVSIESVTKAESKSDAHIFEGGEALVWNIAISDSDTLSSYVDYNLPMTIKLYNLEQEAPLTLSAKGAEGISVSNVEISKPTSDGTATAAFEMKLTDFGVLEPTQNSVTLTLDSVHTDIYTGLPMTITLNTQRKEFFNAYVQPFANDFSTQSSGESQENGKYYTNVTVAPLLNEHIEHDKDINYIIRRIDDTSSEKKQVATGSFLSQHGFTYKDTDALILTKNPKYEVELSSSNSTVVSSSLKDGTRNLTNYELGLMAIDGARTPIEKYGNGISGGLYQRPATESSDDKKYTHTREYYDAGIYHHYYIYDYWNSGFVTLIGTTDKNKVGISYRNKLSIIPKEWTANSIQSNTIAFYGTYDFSSVYGDGTVKLVDVNITDDVKSDPAWNGGYIEIQAEGKKVKYYYDNALPFGFYMQTQEFIDKVAPGGNYTQK